MNDLSFEQGLIGSLICGLKKPEPTAQGRPR
jgi:hypothetical protein